VLVVTAIAVDTSTARTTVRSAVTGRATGGGLSSIPSPTQTVHPRRVVRLGRLDRVDPGLGCPRR
jgi:hypothetical protein